jgi:hypothetical protein
MRRKWLFSGLFSIKYLFVIGIPFFILSGVTAQIGVRLLPEGGLSYPIGDYKSENVFAARGYQYGGHLDLLWGAFGLGVYGGIDKNRIQFEDLLSADNAGLSIEKTAEIERDHWRQWAAGIGPVLRLRLSKRIHFELSSKIGIARFSYPDYSQLAAIGPPLDGEFTLYRTNNAEMAEKFNPMLLSAGRLSIGLARNIELSLSGNFRHVRDVRHAYSYLDGNFSPGMSNDELIAALETAPTVQEIRKCHFNSVGATLGLSVQFGGKSKPGEKIAPPVPSYPADGAIISAQEADSLTLEWQRETPPVEKANYKLWLWKVTGSGADSLLLDTKVKRKQEYALPEKVKLETGGSYKWRLQAVDDSRLGACAGGCYSVEATFQVGAGASEQYHQLLTDNSGNYIEVRNRLRVDLPKNIHMMGKPVVGRIFNQQNDTVWEASDLTAGRQAKNYTMDDYGRLTVPVAHLPAGYYVFELTTENKRAYYFRFQVVNSNVGKKN